MFEDFAGRNVVRWGVTRASPRRTLIALASLAGFAATGLAGFVLDRDEESPLPARPSPAVVAPPVQAASPRPTPRLVTGTPSRTAREGSDDIEAMVGDFERTYQQAADEDLDLLAATRLPGLVQRDPRRVARLIELQPSSKQRRILVRHFSRLWGENDAESAMSWAQALPDAEDSKIARRAACLSLSQTNPAAGIQRCVENDADGEADSQGMF
ncbi:MAG TPA: hypothetical protein VM165_19060, partial [Planctomycetaceae bacterium]|nr:hypothetical protein [Planctomycetaceae bacterium]